MDFTGKRVLITGAGAGIGNTEEIAQAILFAAWEGAGFMTGAVINIDGGMGI